MRAFFHNHIVPTDKLRGAAALVGIFAEHLSIRSNEMAMFSKGEEPRWLTVAKKSMCRSITRKR
jgi:hypothetical protein